MPVMIQAENVRKTYRIGKVDVQALRGVSLQVEQGEFVSIVGPSGSGKTTMLSMISGILRPNSGTVRIQGSEIWTLGNDALAEFPLREAVFGGVTAAFIRHAECPVLMIH